MIAEAFARRSAPGLALAGEADRIARACHAMAARFQDGGKMIAFGNGAQATDAAHLAVEFAHPVTVGRRALPAISLAADPGVLTGVARTAGFDQVYAAQLYPLAEPADIAVGLSPDGRCENVRRGLAAARDRGLLTVALGGGPMPADHALVVDSADPRVVKEIVVTAYHLLWELVHVFLERPGRLAAEPAP
ncbi:phosphoheptose isomerase [Actinomadura craniellae]|uniref:Phosphoheptose isomerase n=1 Tax=Actinomadura craniellae TaxID=2231787 RepID=A0A365H9B3_9ACTN|nr:SIS domain-containing protein [Actinomadura craniellae]RAY15685.1 phosphoheptose isomerase [Actinomadura craniellae]